MLLGTLCGSPEPSLRTTAVMCLILLSHSVYFSKVSLKLLLKSPGGFPKNEISRHYRQLVFIVSVVWLFWTFHVKSPMPCMLTKCNKAFKFLFDMCLELLPGFNGYFAYPSQIFKQIWVTTCFYCTCFIKKYSHKNMW